MSVNERVALYTDVSAGPSACWEWTASRKPAGYGQLNDRGRIVYAHREAYAAVHGPIPEDLQIDHLCRNRGCVNPAHMELVTTAVNVQRGKNSKLSPTKVREIRRLARTHTPRTVIAKRFGVDTSVVGRVIRRQAWSNIDD